MKKQNQIQKNETGNTCSNFINWWDIVFPR